MNPDSATPPPPPLTTLVRVGALSILLLLLGAWVVAIVRADPGELLRRDWVAFHRGGTLFWEGRLREIYPGSFETGYFFLYPPYFIYLCAPLGLLPWAGAYAACVAVAVLAFAGGLRGLRAAVPGRGADHTTAALVAASSAPFVGMLVVGQNSAMFFLLIAVGLLFLRRHRPLAAGLVLGLLVIKPNLGAVFGVLLLATRQWRAVLGMGLSVAALVAATLPLGVGVWQDFFAATARMSEYVGNADMPMWKHQTLYAFWSTTIGPYVSHGMVQVVWAASVVPLLAAAGLSWLGRMPPRHWPRAIGVAVLLIVAANPYLWFYDGLLLAIPGVIWYVERDRYASRTCHRIAGACVAVAYTWQHLSLWILGGGPAMVGLAAAVWLLAECHDLRLTRRRTAPPGTARDAEAEIEQGRESLVRVGANG